jgi:cysteine desulfurase/selenocysteine lyase
MLSLRKAWPAPSAVALKTDMAFDFKNPKNDFPCLKGDALSYLDNAATTQTPEPVLKAMDDYYRSSRANVHRGMYRLAEAATEKFEGAREAVAGFINASSDEIVFTKGATESLNLLASTLCQGLKAGDEIVLTLMEHHANLVPWQQFAKWRGAVIRWIGVKDDFTLDMDEARKLIGPKTKVVAFTHASNVLGTVNPAKELVALARAAGAVSVIDAAQSAPHLPIDVRDLDCDFLAFSGHKMLGPTGVGVLYGKKARLEALPPYQYGGDMILEVTTEASTWNEPPHKFEAGSPNAAGVIGLGAACAYLREIGMDAVLKHERAITAYALEKLAKIEGLTVYGPAGVENRLGAISFTLEGIHPHDIATILDREGVAVRGGHHCAMPLHARLGVPATNRASLYVYNTEADVDVLVRALEKCRAVFK